MEAFKVGDVVRLTCGGPKKTVAAVAGEPIPHQDGKLVPVGCVLCIWFHFTTRHELLFRVEALERAPR